MRFGIGIGLGARAGAGVFAPCLRVSVVMLAVLGGCTVHPRGESAERQAALEAGKVYDAPHVRDVPAELKSDASVEEMVQHGLLVNGELEAKYWEWRAALEKVPMVGTQKSGVELSLESMIMDGQSGLEDFTLGIANDAMNSLMVPTKLGSEAAMALHEAQAAGRRFDAARWELRRKIVAGYLEYALTAEEMRLEEANGRILETMVRVTETRVTTGMATQAELLRAGNESAMSKNTAAGLKGKLPGERAMLNELLGRPGDAALDVPGALPARRELGLDDAGLLALGSKRNPELQALAHMAAGNRDGIKRAWQEYIPDFNVSFSSDLAGMTQTVMGSVVLPYLRHEALEAGVRQAEANLRQTEAMQRQTSRGVAARVVADLAMLREAERQAGVLEGDLIPRAQQLVEVARTAYATGNGMMADLLEAQRSVLTLRRMAAEMRIEREKQIADLEEVCGGLPG